MSLAESITAEVDRLLADRTKRFFETGISYGRADERCRLLEWVKKQHDPALDRAISNYIMEGENNGKR